jgi:hypothetical protein
MPRWGERMSQLEQTLDDQTEVRLLREHMLRAVGRASYEYYRAKYEHALHELRVTHRYRQDQLDWVTRQDMPLPEAQSRYVRGDITYEALLLAHERSRPTYAPEHRPAPPPPKPHQCQYGQGMTRGYWRGGLVGRHPGYRSVVE